MGNEVRELKKYIDDSKKTIAVTGSGISYLSGVGKLKKMEKMDLILDSSAEYVKSHPDEFYAIMKEAFLDAIFEKGPSPVHRQLAELEKRGKLQGIITNNMDCLHTIAGSTNVIELQKGFWDNICVDCESRYDDYTVWGHGKIPRCPKCGGPLIPANFYRGTGLYEKELKEQTEKAGDMISDAELVMVIGTTGFFSDEYMGRMDPKAEKIQINPSSTKFDRMADENIRIDAEEVFDEILNEE